MLSENSILNEEIIDDLRAILGDSYLDICQDQITQASDYICEIKGLLAKGEYETVSKRSHSLKSSAGQVGLQSIYLLAKELEYICASDAAKGENSERGNQVFVKLLQEFDMAVKCLYGYIGVQAPPPTAIAN